MESDASESVDIADYARPVWRRKWLILVAVVVATGAVYSFYAQQPKEYTSGTLVFAQDPGDPVAQTGVQPGTDRSVQNQAALLYSESVADAVKKRIGYGGTANELLSSVRIKARTGQDIIEISARAKGPGLVADIANGYAKEFVARTNGTQRTRVQQAASLARKQLRGLPETTVTRGAREELGDRIRALDLALSLPQTSSRQIDPAVPPGAAAAPKPTRNALFAFVLSLVLSVAVAFGLERFDRRMKRPEDVRDAYGLPLLAVLPHSDKSAPVTGGVASLAPELKEAFRALRTNIDLGSLDAPPRTIVVTSGIRGEGKSTVVRNLALAFRETGKRVAVVECDLRRPSLAGVFGHDKGPGFTEVLSGQAQLEDVVLQTRAAVPGVDDVVRANGSDPSDANEGGSPGWRNDVDNSVTLLLAGATPANPPVALTSGRAREILDQVAASHDITIIDSAPLLSVTDTVPLLRVADAVILVSRLDYTPQASAKRVIELLDRVPDATALGVVANDLTRLNAMGYGYGPDYGYAYDAAPGASMSEKRASPTKSSDQAG